MMEDIIKNPYQIETTSMEIIEGLLPPLDVTPEEKKIIKRVVHTTADPEFAKILKIHPQAVESGLSALKKGCKIFTDVTMIQAGVNKRKLTALGGEISCLIADESIKEESQKLGITRAMLSMRRLGEELNGNIIAIGNAPTALFELHDQISKGLIKPALVIGVPVGFVGAKESKALFAELDIPYIVTVGPKGGSTIAASILNALIYLLSEEEKFA